MGILRRLFGKASGPDRQTASIIVLFPVERDMIEQQSGYDRLQDFVRDHVATIVRMNEYLPITMSISGYDSDPRELHEVPEVCAWARKCREIFPSVFYLLDLPSKKRFAGWLCGPVSIQEVATAKFATQFAGEFTMAFMQARPAAEKYLLECGAPRTLVDAIRATSDIRTGASNTALHPTPAASLARRSRRG